MPTEEEREKLDKSWELSCGHSQNKGVCEKKLVNRGILGRVNIMMLILLRFVGKEHNELKEVRAIFIRLSTIQEI
jgi:hypothetical protein